LQQSDEDATRRAELGSDRLLRTATIYEALVDSSPIEEHRRPAAFVAATAYQILGRVGLDDEISAASLLSRAAIHPNVSAPLLFLIAEQSPDAREAARRIEGRRASDLLTTALLESIADLATEKFQSILERAERLRDLNPSRTDLTGQATQALYGLCWSGIIQMVSRLLGRPTPTTSFRDFESPAGSFAAVERLAVSALGDSFGADDLIGSGTIAPLPHLISTFAGPRHLARLLGSVDQALSGNGLAQLPSPTGTNPKVWKRWVGHRANSKPLLWPNHRPAISKGILELGRSAVLVLPTGAGKTTLSELKIAATLAAGKKVIFLVPTLALVDQLRDDLAASFPQQLSDVVVSVDGDLATLAHGPTLSDIEVMTPERLLAMLSFADADVSEVGLIVFDECHLISPKGGGTRSVDAMLCVLHANKRAPQADLLFLSAMVSNGQEIADWLSSLTGRECQFFEDPWKPSRQARGVVVYPRSELQPIERYARSVRRGLPIARPELKVRPFGLFGLQNNWSPNSEADLRLTPLIPDTVTIDVSKFGPTPNANAVASELARRAAAAKLKTIIFVQQADHAPSTARKLSAKLPRTDRLLSHEQSLLSDIQTELGPRAASLVDPAAGCLPHNGDMLPQERRLAESLFRRSDGANVIVATPTLAQGMNLPAQLAILAGNKRHDEAGRSELQRHELLNAAGRAGRAGYLANGVVLLVPEPVVGFDPTGGPDFMAYEKLRSILPKTDQSIEVEDPLTSALDQIQVGQFDGAGVRYLISRLRAGEEPVDGTASALEMVNKSLFAFHARTRGEQESVAITIANLKSALTEEDERLSPDELRIAALSGLSIAAVQTMADRVTAQAASLPSNVSGWIDWIVEFLRDDPEARQALLGVDEATITAVSRGKKTGGPPTPKEFELFRRGLKAWVEGKPFDAIEQALGVSGDKIGACPRARDLVFKLTNRRLYLLFVALAEIVKARVFSSLPPPSQAVVEILPIAIRRGYDSAEKAAFALLNPSNRTRVATHREFERKLGQLAPFNVSTFREVIRDVELTLTFSDDEEEEDQP
jgi:superfamily II DNA/RNA helicase